MMIQIFKQWFILFVLALSGVGTSQASMIEYTASNISGSSWQYDYNIINDSVSFDIDEFTIYFSQSSYANLSLATAPANWDPVFWQPGSILGFNDGGFDSLALSGGVMPGQSLSGFSIRFDWLGAGTPGSQAYEFVDPSNVSNVLDTGVTVQAATAVPVPAAVWLFGSGFLALCSLRSRRVNG